ncbi:MAG: DUF5615 family PIN-like protein [Acidobacteriota bacterium]
MALKLLADPLFPETVVEQLNRAGYDAVHAGAIGAADLPVREILKLADFEQRIILTADRVLARIVESESGRWPSLICFIQVESGPEGVGPVLLNLLELFDEDLAQGAMVIVRDGQTLLRKFVPPLE